MTNLLRKSILDVRFVLLAFTLFLTGPRALLGQNNNCNDSGGNACYVICDIFEYDEWDLADRNDNGSFTAVGKMLECTPDCSVNTQMILYPSICQDVEKRIANSRSFETMASVFHGAPLMIVGCETGLTPLEDATAFRQGPAIYRRTKPLWNGK